jgi:hypothetical protein
MDKDNLLNKILFAPEVYGFFKIVKIYDNPVTNAEKTGVEVQLYSFEREENIGLCNGDKIGVEYLLLPEDFSQEIIDQYTAALRLRQEALLQMSKITFDVIRGTNFKMPRALDPWLVRGRMPLDVSMIIGST